MKRFNIFFGLPLLSLILVIAACGGSAEPAATQPPQAQATATPKAEETTLRVGYPFLRTLRPFTMIQMGLGETLFRLGEEYRPVPWLATEAKNLDEKTWEITLRQGVKFHNGAEMDAAAVKASLEWGFAESASTKALLDTAAIEVKDAYTLTITTNSPSPILPNLLTEAGTVIVEPGAAQAMENAFYEKPVLTGPFKVERFQQSKELVALRHSDYWGARPLVDRLVATYIQDNNSLVLALQADDIDIAVGIPAHSVQPVVDHPNLVVRQPAKFSINFMFLNTQRDAMKDIRVRQAIAHAIDRAALVKGVMSDQADPAVGLFPPNMLQCDGLEGGSFDPPTARQLLTAAGYEDPNGDGLLEKDGRPLEIVFLTYGQGGFLPPMAEAIQVMLKNIGIKANIRMVERVDAVLEQ